MIKELLEILICPACLPQETPLFPVSPRFQAGEMLSGSLECRRCTRQYPVESGVAFLLPHGGKYLSSRYEDEAALSAYLWSHYGDLGKEETPNRAYQQWAGLLRPVQGLGLDIGCATGRMTFEMAGNCELAVGMDLSRSFVECCRKLAHTGKLEYHLVMEGKITEPRRITLPASFRRKRTEFLVASALALPFPRSCFSLAVSLNILDKISRPLAHLQETNRISTDRNAACIISDPFSWSEETAPEEEWLGGRNSGRFSGWGIDNVRGLLLGKSGLIHPAWRVREEGRVFWTIRNHRNHFEQIQSHYIAAER